MFKNIQKHIYPSYREAIFYIFFLRTFVTYRTISLITLIHKVLTWFHKINILSFLWNHMEPNI